MAKGDLLFFNDFVDDLGTKIHDLDADTIKMALVTNATVPSVTTAAPSWGAGGSTNFLTTEVSGTNYTTGGIDIAATFSTSGAVGTFDGATNPAWTQHASGPPDIRWGIIYNETATAKDCIAFIDMGGGADISLADGNISFTFAASIGTITRT